MPSEKFFKKVLTTVKTILTFQSPAHEAAPI